MAIQQSLEYERLIVPRVRRSASLQSSATVLKTALSRLDYQSLMKADVDTYSGSPKSPPEWADDTISVCLTAYNEDIGAYHDSLSALARAADHFVHAGEPKLSQHFTICILVDGLAKMSAAFADYAQSLGIYQPALLDPRADYHLFETSIDRHLLQYGSSAVPTGRMGDPTSAGQSQVLTNLSDSVSRQRIVLFIKNTNGGKLDSHRCYFEIVCRHVRPAYFLQVDVGTSPDPNAVYAMWQRVARCKDVAAVSARSHMPLPRGRTDLLGIWQYGDIASERILLWPTEVLMGYMSVLSGQFCMTRSDAVWDVENSSTDEPAAIEQPSSARDGVMRKYLRGLTSLGPFESNMFLAEDRILGLEIVFQPDSRWELGYVPEANAAIDRCDTWNELLCQRRRWTCSSVACRLWMFTRVFDYAKSANRTWRQKLRILSASAFHSLYFLMQWLMPACALMLFSSLHHIVSSSPGMSAARGLINWAFACVLGLLATQLAISATGKLTPRTDRFFSFSMAFQTVYVLALSAVAIAANLTSTELMAPLALLALVLGAVLLLSRWYARSILDGLAKSLLIYWASRPAVAFMVMTHAALNSHDTSWGTKGLNRPSYLDDVGREGSAEVRHFRKRHFDFFRWKTVSLVLIANTGFYALAAAQGWTRSFAGIEAVLTLILAQVSIAFLARAVIAFKSRG